eukprot:TRINITY_DN19364_c0_g1_i1.p1 TRINITY_DN19364_c0_g1~~TRINITY_DN19364_c0_g1_i1.p1  ORF type:complete len:258 (+),score=44.12 TRINITY_DN19364_c0_g1_i1:91-864(+)
MAALPQPTCGLLVLAAALLSGSHASEACGDAQDRDYPAAISLLQRRVSKIGEATAIEFEANNMTSRQKLCIFDIDQTLSAGRWGNTSAGWPLQAIEECLQKGYKIGMATARPAISRVTTGRPSSIPEGLLPDSFYHSPAFQMAEFSGYNLRHQISSLGGLNKTGEILRILHYYDIQPECAVFFDDMIDNLKIVNESPGTRRVVARPASSSACSTQSQGWFGSGFSPLSKIHCMTYATGLTPDEFRVGMEALDASCPT